MVRSCGMRLAAAVISASTGGSLAQPDLPPDRTPTSLQGVPLDWETPTSHRLAGFARGIYQPQGQAILAVVGDSINAPIATVSMQIGYRDCLEIPFNGWVVHADNGNADIGYMNAQGSLAVDTVRDPGDVFAGGVSAISPVRAREAVWDANVWSGGTLSDCFVINAHLGAMKLGNPFAKGALVDVRLMMFEGVHQLGGFEAVGVRGSTDISTGAYHRPDPVSGRIVWIDRAAGAGFSNPGVRLRSDASTAESAAGANAVVLLGARFRAQIPSGVQVQFISHGGWTTADHLDPARFTDEALRQYYAATGSPTHAILWLGQNQTPPEAMALVDGDPRIYQDNVVRVMARHDAAITSLGAPPPRWLLVSQYKTGYDRATHELMSRALFKISQVRPYVSFLNIYRLAGGEDFNQQDHLSDGVHPSTAGARFLASLMNQEMKASLTCLADFDRSGFIDRDDFDCFVQAFEAGDGSADIDETGFVDTDDFDTFIAAFESGC